MSTITQQILPLTRKQVAEAFAVEPRTISRWCEQRILTPLNRRGYGPLRISADEVVARLVEGGQSQREAWDWVAQVAQPVRKAPKPIKPAAEAADRPVPALPAVCRRSAPSPTVPLVDVDMGIGRLRAGYTDARRVARVQELQLTLPAAGGSRG